MEDFVNLNNSQSLIESRGAERPSVDGKFIFAGGEKLYIRGVTYGTFAPNETGDLFPNHERVRADFAQMSAYGINTLRTYTVPPQWLLDEALSHGLLVMVGMPWEQHITFLDNKDQMRSIERRVRDGVRACSKHPAILCYAIGNEIPSQIVRWHSRKRIERFLKRLYNAAKSEDPEGLVTYVNYPSTEYLQLSFLDFLCFNVYLESPDRLEAYVARLQNIAGDSPLVLAEIGLDSSRNGLEAQAESLAWQVRSAFAGGCAGAFVFSWTDEWHRGGFEIEDWDFGLTTRERSAKPALTRVSEAFSEVPFPANPNLPRISVVVCSYNGACIIRGCLDALAKLEYPNYEVIIVNDGSTDSTEAIAREYGSEYSFRVISTENRGLSSARNTGMEASTGEIIAYIDDDAYPDPHWLSYLAWTFMTTDHAGVGGPNIAPPGDGTIADCVANSPGGPVHVLLTDTVAEHIPGCNSAYRKSCLEAIGGWDPQFRTAGDDVDLCWRLQEMGWTIGFNPSAVVWHHRRNSVRTYWRQQVGYGRAEALLEKKWPEKYNALGHVSWGGRLYGKGLTQILSLRAGRIYQGIWGSAPFQSLEKAQTGTISELPLMPEWFLVVAALAAFSALVNTLWVPSITLQILVLLFATAPFVQAGLSAARASFSNEYMGVARLGAYALTAFLHILQPTARLVGRLRYGLTLWRKRDKASLALPVPRRLSIWSERWKDHAEWLSDVESRLRGDSLIVRRGGVYDNWDLEVSCGTIGAVRTLMTIEEHGAGKQMVRFSAWPTWSWGRIIPIVTLTLLSFAAWADGAYSVSAILGVLVFLVVTRKIREYSVSIGAIQEAIGHLKTEAEPTAPPAVQEAPVVALGYEGINKNGGIIANGNGRLTREPEVGAALINGIAANGHERLPGEREASSTLSIGYRLSPRVVRGGQE